MLKQIVNFVVLIVEQQRLQDLVNILISPLHFGLWCREMCIDYGHFGLANFDGTADGAFVSTDPQNASTDLSQLEIFQYLLGVSFI